MNCDPAPKVLCIASACLAGLACRYDASAKTLPEIAGLYKRGLCLALCPERLAGLPTPRPPCEQLNGRIIRIDGQDLTDAFMSGAQKALDLAMASGCRLAIIKSRSPSCGIAELYDGTFSGHTRPGMGIFAAMLQKRGFDLYPENDLDKVLARLAPQLDPK